jgi:hypothetical protein
MSPTEVAWKEFRAVEKQKCCWNKIQKMKDCCCSLCLWRWRSFDVADDDSGTVSAASVEYGDDDGDEHVDDCANVDSQFDAAVVAVASFSLK